MHVRARRRHEVHHGRADSASGTSSRVASRSTTTTRARACLAFALTEAASRPETPLFPHNRRRGRNAFRAPRAHHHTIRRFGDFRARGAGGTALDVRFAIGSRDARGVTDAPSTMFTRLVKQFNARGARDHLRGARRLQEEADLHRLYVLTSFYRREGDGSALVDAVMEEGKHLGFDELKAEVSSNLTDQIHRSCAAVRDAVVAAAAAPPRGDRPSSPTPPSAPSDSRAASRPAAPARTAATASSSAASSTLERSSRSTWRRVRPRRPQAHARLPRGGPPQPVPHGAYDGSVVDANPWGRGGPVVHPSSHLHTRKDTGDGPVHQSPLSLPPPPPPPPPPGSRMRFAPSSTPRRLRRAPSLRLRWSATTRWRWRTSPIIHLEGSIRTSSSPRWTWRRTRRLTTWTRRRPKRPSRQTRRRCVGFCQTSAWGGPRRRRARRRHGTRAREGGFIGRLQDAFGTRDDGPPPSDRRGKTERERDASSSPRSRSLPRRR